VLSARAILDRNALDYSIYRGILYPVLLTPATAIGRIAGSADVAFILAHVSAVLLFGALLIATYPCRTTSGPPGSRANPSA
jgi:hypothetical protein